MISPGDAAAARSPGETTSFEARPRRSPRAFELGFDATAPLEIARETRGFERGFAKRSRGGRTLATFARLGRACGEARAVVRARSAAFALAPPPPLRAIREHFYNLLISQV